MVQGGAKMVQKMSQTLLKSTFLIDLGSRSRRFESGYPDALKQAEIQQYQGFPLFLCLFTENDRERPKRNKTWFKCGLSRGIFSKWCKFGARIYADNE